MTFETKGQLFNNLMSDEEKSAAVQREVERNANESAIRAEKQKQEDRLKMIFFLAKKNEIVEEETSYEEFINRNDLDVLIKKLTIEQQD